MAETREDIGHRWAPIIYQGAWFDGRYDVPTVVSFDGDYRSTNNWASARSTPISPSVYFDVLSTSTHHFVFYQLFYPRDYEIICLFGGCHENDLEAVRVVVARGASPESDHLLWIETSAHGRFTTNVAPSMEYVPNELWARPAIYSDHGGHPLSSDRRLFTKAKWKFVPVSNQKPQPMSTQLKPYALVSISELWLRRQSVGHHLLWSKTFDYRGERCSIPKVPTAMAGVKWKRDAANPVFARGDWFFDPALDVKKTLGAPDSFSLAYESNTYCPGLEKSGPSDHL